jgi:hypothetical protein
MTAESYMIRNWMANIGNNNVVFQDWTGKYIIGERSERGERVKRSFTSPSSSIGYLA